MNTTHDLKLKIDNTSIAKTHIRIYTRGILIFQNHPPQVTLKSEAIENSIKRILITSEILQNRIHKEITFQIWFGLTPAIRTWEYVTQTHKPSLEYHISGY